MRQIYEIELLTMAIRCDCSQMLRQKRLYKGRVGEIIVEVILPYLNQILLTVSRVFA